MSNYIPGDADADTDDVGAILWEPLYYSWDSGQMTWPWSHSTLLPNLLRPSVLICKVWTITYILYLSVAVLWGPNKMMYVTENSHTGSKNHTNEKKWEAQWKEHSFCNLRDSPLKSWIRIFTSCIIICKFLNLSDPLFSHMQMVQKTVVKIQWVNGGRADVVALYTCPLFVIRVLPWHKFRPVVLDLRSLAAVNCSIVSLPAMQFCHYLKQVYRPANSNTICPEKMTVLSPSSCPPVSPKTQSQTDAQWFLLAVLV